MSKSALLEVLTDLNENRRLSFEVGELIEPFEGKAYALSFFLFSSSNTLGNRFGSEYHDGSTLTCKLEGGSLEANVQTTTGEQAFVDGLDPEATFEMQVTLLDFDTLYQRPIFGTVPEQTEAAEEPAEDLPDEPVVAPPAEVVEVPVDSAEEEIEEEVVGEEPEPPEPVAPVEKPVETVVEESNPIKEEQEEEKDLRKERKKLIDQLSDTVGAWRTSSGKGASYETKEEAEEKTREIYYEGEESEWGAPAKPTTPWEDSTPPAYTSEPEKQGCGALSGCNILFVIGIFAFVGILGLLFENNPSPEGDETKPPTFDERMNWYRRNAMEVVAKTELQEEDRRALRGLASLLWDICYTKVPRWVTPNTPAPSMETLEELTEAYAWKIIALGVDGHTTRGLFENSQRKHPFHWLEDWNVIDAKTRAALRTPHLAPEAINLLKVTELDLSNEELKDLGYLATLPALQVLSLANNPIEDLKPLIHLKKLKHLDLSETNPKDLAPLQEIESLQLLTLTLRESQLTQLEQLKKARPDLQITLGTL